MGTTIVPPAYAATVEGSGFLGPLSNSQRTYQILLRDSILQGLVGQSLTAITWRLLPSATANWPASDITFTNYDIYIGAGVAPENRSLTFANNVAGPQKKVRSGPLTITAGSFTFGGSPNTFGSDITFDSGYTYTGGHLLIEIRHTGFSGSSASVDAAGTSTPGYAFLYSACWQSSYTATTGLQGNVCISKINSETLVGINDPVISVNGFSLSQNYPNPFNPVTSIAFNMKAAGKVTLKVYDLSGTEVETLIDGANYNSGAQSFNFNASHLASGVYFYSLFVDNNKIDTKKMMLVK